MRNSQIVERLYALQDLSYKEFHSKLVPNISPDKIIGVRTPELRKLSKELAGSELAIQHMKQLPHQYYEEDNLHGFFIEQIKDYEECIEALNGFLPYVDNWATCDLMTPKIFKKHLPKLLEQIKIWLRSEHTYMVRFGMKMLMSFYLDEVFEEEYLELVVSVHSEEYYIKMMQAWFFATALAKQYEKTLPYIENQRLDVWTHNKAIQKAVESYRITPEQKTCLRTWKVKNKK